LAGPFIISLDLQMGPRIREVKVNGRKLDLTTVEFDVLKVLVRSSGEVVLGAPILGAGRGRSSAFSACLLFSMNRGQWCGAAWGISGRSEGLSLSKLIRRTAWESWEDSVFGRGGRMAFYYFLAIFPSLIISAGPPYFRDALLDLSRRTLP
jgi:hypothetical protein